jgi:outer membrane protein OmpA-like peptidoglycan-associated protein
MTRISLVIAATAASIFATAIVSQPAHAWADKCRENVDARIDEEYRIYFSSSDNHLSDDAIKRIDRADSIAKARDVEQICIVGQASKEGDSKANANLAYARAEMVADAFVKRGWRRDQIVVESTGESWGFLTDILTSDSSADRRVDVTFSY